VISLKKLPPISSASTVPKNDMEIEWAIPDDDKVAEEKERIIPRPASADPPAELGILMEENAALRAQVKEWKLKAQDWETRAVLHENHLEDIKKQKFEQKLELEAALEEISRLRAELRKPWWRR
jgi:hypothetical protein